MSVAAERQAPAKPAPATRGWANAANALTASRLVLAAVFGAAVLGEVGALAVASFAAAAASDVADGALARRQGTASQLGRWLDHCADITFLLVALSVYVWIGLAPWFVPASIAAAFAFYVLDSTLRRGSGHLVGSRTGHLGGVLNFGLVGWLAIDVTAGLAVVPRELHRWLFALVPVYSAASVITRLRASPGQRRGEEQVNDGLSQ